MSNSASFDDPSSRRDALRAALIALAERIVPAGGTHPDRLAFDAAFPVASFHEALLDASYWSDGVRADTRSFRRAYADGRIRPECLRWAIGRSVVGGIGLDRPMLGPLLTAGRVLELALLEDIAPRRAAESPAVSAAAAADGALLATCLDRVLRLGCSTPIPSAAPELRRGERVLRRAGCDPDSNAHAVLVSLLRAFVASADDGGSSAGFYAAVRDGRLVPPTPAPVWLDSLEHELAWQRAAGLDAEAALGAALETLSFAPAHQAGYVGALARVERRGIERLASAMRSRGERGLVYVSALTEALAVRAWLDVLARRDAARTMGLDLRDLGSPLDGTRPLEHDASPEHRAAELARLLRAAGLEASAFAHVTAADLRNLFSLLERFDDLSRAKVWQDAFDRSRLLELGREHARGQDSSPCSGPGRPEPVSMREAASIGSSIVFIGRTPPELPLHRESFLFLPYDSAADSEGSELAWISRLVPRLVRSGFERYLRRAGCGSSELRAALVREIMGEEASAFDALDAIPLIAECCAGEPVAGRTLFVVEASCERVAELIARDGRLQDLQLLGWLTIASFERGSIGAAVVPFDAVKDAPDASNAPRLAARGSAS